MEPVYLPSRTELSSQKQEHGSMEPNLASTTLNSSLRMDYKTPPTQTLYALAQF